MAGNATPQPGSPLGALGAKRFVLTSANVPRKGGWVGLPINPFPLLEGEIMKKSERTSWEK